MAGNRIKDNWTDDGFAAEWDAAALAGNPTRRFLLSVVGATLALRQERTGTLRLLEIGSGSGLVSEFLLSELPRATIDGVDFSEAMIARATKRLARFGARFRQFRADLAQPDATTLPPGPYDAAIVLQVLHEVPRAAKLAVLRELRGRLAADGILLYGERLRADYAGFADAHEALWSALAGWTPDIVQPAFAERATSVARKSDFTTTLADELVAFAEAGYRAEPLLVLGERCLLAARPAGQAAATSR